MFDKIHCAKEEANGSQTRPAPPNPVQLNLPATGSRLNTNIYVSSHTSGSNLSRRLRLLCVNLSRTCVAQIEELFTILGIVAPLNFADPQEAIKNMTGQPHGVLVDVWKESSRGAETIRQLNVALPQVPVIVYTSRTDEVGLFEALDGGATGYLIHPLSREELMEALTSLVHGHAAFSRRAGDLLLGLFRKPRAFAADCYLSKRELQIVTCLAARYTNKEIANKLGIREGTVHAHLIRIYRRTGARNREEVIRMCRGLQ